jgi:hypothetical protein
VFASRDLEWSLYDFALFERELLERNAALAPYVAFGFGGHGLVSQALHYYAVTDHYAILLQAPWGNLADDPKQEAERYRGLMLLVAMLDEDVRRATAAGVFPKDRRIVVSHSAHAPARWGWLERRAGAQPAWRDTDGSGLLDASAEIQQLMTKG